MLLLHLCVVVMTSVDADAPDDPEDLIKPWSKPFDVPITE